MFCHRHHCWPAILCLAISVPAEARVSVTTASLQLHFDPHGQLVEAVACHPDCADAAVRRVTLSAPEGLVAFEGAEGAGWSVTQRDRRRSRVLEFSGPGGRLLRWSIPKEGYGIGVTAEGLGALTLQSGDSLQPRPAAGFGNWLEQVRYVAIDLDGARQFGLDDAEAASIQAEWAGFRNRFWALLASADFASGFQLSAGEGNAHPRVVRPTSGASQRLLLYFGPVERRELAAVDVLLQQMQYSGLWFWLRWICFALLYLLTWVHGVGFGWGVSIVLLSVLVNVLMRPLSRMAERLQRQVHVTEARLAPELARIRQCWHGEEQAARIIALYRSEGVHPLYSVKSLLGVAIVIPVFIGAFDMLAGNIHLLHTPFLWIEDLSRPDAIARLPFELPYFGAELNLLPFLMTGLSVLASVLHRPAAQHPDLRRRQRRNMIGLAAAFFVLFYTFPAGMVLYWTANNLIAVGKGLWERLHLAGRLVRRRAET